MDSCCFIDLAKNALSLPVLAKRDPHVFFCRKFLDAARANDVTVYTSTMTVIECVYVTDNGTPGKQAIEDDGVKAIFRGMLLSGKSGVMPVIPTVRITDNARDLRWQDGITCKPIDRLHIATAIAMKCTHFFTSDDKLGSENIRNIANLGLTVCMADKAADLLPTHYRQFELKPAGGKP